MLQDLSVHCPDIDSEDLQAAIPSHMNAPTRLKSDLHAILSHMSALSPLTRLKVGRCRSLGIFSQLSADAAACSRADTSVQAVDSLDPLRALTGLPRLDVEPRDTSLDPLSRLSGSLQLHQLS
jgi:hypothetical protein